MRFKKKPVEVEAIRFTGDNWAEMHEFTGHHNSGGREVDALVERPAGAQDPEFTAMVFDVLHETWVKIKPGQWVIRGTLGEFYACEDDGTGNAPQNYDAVLICPSCGHDQPRKYSCNHCTYWQDR